MSKFGGLGKGHQKPPPAAAVAGGKAAIAGASRLRETDDPDGERVAALKNVLFVCSQNRLRSPKAEQIFSGRPGLEVSSAGTNHDSENPLTAELVAWADIIFVMEKAHRGKLQKRFGAALKGARVVSLDIPTTTSSWTRC